MTLGRFSHAANISGVWPWWVSLALTSAAASRRTFTAATLPDIAAPINAVAPVELAWLGSAPAASSSSTISALPFLLARMSGVIEPTRVRTSRLALAPITSFATSTSSWNVAQ